MRKMESVVGGHAHSFAIEVAAIDKPPADGVSGPSGVAEGHSHNVAVSAAQLSSISRKSKRRASVYQ